MNGRERLARVLTGQPVDRPPVVPVLSLYGARLAGYDAQEYYTDANSYAAGQSAVYDLLAPDVLFAPFALTVEGVAFGGQERFLARHPPNMHRFAVESPSDLSRLRAPNPRVHPRLVYVREAITRMRDQLGQHAMICGICTAPVDTPALVMGMDAWMQTFLFDDQGRDAVLDITIPFFIDWANALLAAGADFIGLPVAFANPNLITRHQAETQIVPILQRAFAEIKGPIVFHHAGCTLGPFVSLYKDLPNLIGFALDPRDRLADARQEMGPGQLLLGNINGQTLGTLSPAAVREQAGLVLHDRAGDPKFVLATSGPDIPWETPPANLLALVDAAEDTFESSEAPQRKSKTTVVACSIFRSLIEAMDWDNDEPRRVRYISSILHVVPEELDAILASLLDYERSRGLVLVAFGDCTSRLVQRCQQTGIRRIPVANCCQPLLGADRYRDLCKNAEFAFLPEWTVRWRSVLTKAFGASEETMRAFFRDTNRGLVFLDSPADPVRPEKVLEISEFFGLPFTVEHVSSESFQRTLRSEMRALRTQGA